MQAIRLVFKYLPIAYENPHDEEARSMMHNAACIAAIAFSNASVGVNHALAHAFGARFGVAARTRQRADAAARDRLQRGGADQVHAFAQPARVCGAQEIRHDGRLAGTGRPHGRGESAEPGDRDRATARPTWRFRGRSRSWESRKKSSSVPCPIWRRLRSTILRGARIRACRWSANWSSFSGARTTDAERKRQGRRQPRSPQKRW